MFMMLNVCGSTTSSYTSGSGSMYRPPSASEKYYEQMVDVLEHFTNCNNHVIVMSDFNYNCAPDGNDCCHISHIEQLTRLSQIVIALTRVAMTTSSLIDIIHNTITFRNYKKKCPCNI